jgi:hypothetical protein
MVTCKLQGGLGNQMFQIAATYALSLKHNGEYFVNLKDCYTPNQGTVSINYKNTIFSKVNDYENFEQFHIYQEPNFSYGELPWSKRLLLIGSFQSEKYFIDYREEILNLFQLPDEAKQKVSEYLNNIGVNPNRKLTSIHIRRGDYLKFSQFHALCSVEYYNEAISIIKNYGDSDFIFISDDIEWVKENFNGDGYFYSDLNDDILDLTLQTICDNNIIANSSFSWWGAWLNQSEDKKVIAPKEWFGPAGHKDIQDVIPNNWVKC